MTWTCRPDCGLCCHEPLISLEDAIELMHLAVRQYVIVRLGNGVIKPQTMDHRCPWLGTDGKCVIYNHRFHVCWAYGPHPHDFCPFIDGDGTPRPDEGFPDRWLHIQPDRLQEYREKGVLH